LTSRYDLDCQEISRIQFHTDFDRKTKNKMTSEIEKRMAIEEQKELDGQGDGYYND
jgi:hypothetical protein